MTAPAPTELLAELRERLADAKAKATETAKVSLNSYGAGYDLGYHDALGELLEFVQDGLPQSEVQSDYVMVPKAALAWLHGEGPDAEGKHFGECEDIEIKTPRKYSRRYWWRSKFRELCGSAPVAQASKVPGFVKPDTDREVFFYEQDFYVLSNFSAFRLDWNGLIFDTSEAAYHYEKFAGTVYENIGREIRNAHSAHEAFKLAEIHKDKRRPDWDDIKVDVMRDILRTKAAQHEYVKRKLLATGDRELIEDSWRDDFWGWGPNRDGKNMLGELWMQVRSEIRAYSVPSASRGTEA